MSAPPANPFLAAALDYARRGWRVVPLAAKDKRPWVKDWVNAATTDLEQLRRWWVERAASNVGVALGSASGLVAIDVDTAGGCERLAAMAEGDLPPTCEMATGKGMRFLFAIPADLGFEPAQVVLKGAGGEEELRLQGKGGQCVMPPSIHPNGKTYAWVEGRSPADLSPAPMPGWLIEAMLPERAEMHEPAAAGTWDAGGDFNRRGDWWADVLEPAGFKRAGTSAGGVERFTRPGKDGGVSVTVGHYKARDGSPALYVFTGSIPELPAGKCFDKFGAFVRLFHGGNFKLAAEALGRKGFGTPRPAGTRPGAKAGGPPPPAPPQKPDAGITAAELIRMDFPPLQFALDGLLVEGLTILAGRPKKGKSWLSLMIGWAVAGGHELDGRKTTSGEVLYLALEDTRRRLKGRLEKLRGGVDPWPVPATLHLHTSWPRGADGLQALGEWLAVRKGKARLVIVDTLAKFRPPTTGQSNGYGEDYEAIAGIKGVADAYGASVLVVHHTRKMKAEDPFDEVSGTLGLSGAADGIWVLDSGDDKTADLFVTGRDVPEATIPLTFDAAFARWRLGESVDGVVKGGRVQTPTPAAEKRDRAKTWLLEFLATHAHPSAEIDKAAKVAGHGFTALRDAKAALGRQGTQEITNHNFRTGGANDWWSGLGPVSGWSFRPGPGIPPGFGESGSQEVRGRRKTTERGSPGESDSLDGDEF
jgi:hypothetical protein